MFRGLFKAVVTCYILCGSDLVSFYGKKKLFSGKFLPVRL